MQDMFGNRRADSTHFLDTGALTNFLRVPRLKLTATGERLRAPTEKRSRIRGFIGISFASGLETQNHLPDPDLIDKIDYELEIELGPTDFAGPDGF